MLVRILKITKILVYSGFWPWCILPTNHRLYKPGPIQSPDINMKCVSWYNLIFWNLPEKSPFYYVLINKEIRPDQRQTKANKKLEVTSVLIKIPRQVTEIYILGYSICLDIVLNRIGTYIRCIMENFSNHMFFLLTGWAFNIGSQIYGPEC